MSTKNYLSVLVLLLILAGSVSALVVDDAQTIATGMFKINLVVAEGFTNPGTLQVDPTGNLTFTHQVLFNSMDADPNIPSKLVINGGICKVIGNDGVRFPGTLGPVEIWINAGTLTVHEFQNNTAIKPGGGTIWIGGGSLTVEQGYRTGNEQTDPAMWAGNGSLKPQPGYTISYEDLGDGAVRIYGVGRIFSPAPANNYQVTNLMLPNLSWKASGVKICKVWFGQAAATKDDYKTKLSDKGNSATLDPNVVTDVSFPLTGLTPAVLPLTGNAFAGVTYSWAVEGYEKVVGGLPDTLVDVAVYQFKVFTRPVVRTQPTAQYVLAGETATFTTEVESYTALTSWNWYKVGSGTPIAGTKTGPDGNNRYQLTLTLPSVGWASQGLYYCSAVNGAGQINSAQANLVIKTLLAHWAFEGNLNDTAPKTVHTTVYNGTAAVTPNYVASSGLDPNALNFDGTNQYVTLPTGFADFSTGVTISVWAVMDNDVRRQARFMDFAQQNGGTFANSVNFARYETTPGLRFRAGNNSDVPEGIKFGEWQHYLVSMNVAGKSKIYVDGLQIGSAFTSMPANVSRTLNYIGEANETDLTHRGAYYKGKIGDMRIYNYAISAEQVKDLYAELHGPFCENRSAYDLSGNCIVDLADLVMFASDWLGCGRWPDTACP